MLCSRRKTIDTHHLQSSVSADVPRGTWRWHCRAGAGAQGPRRTRQTRTGITRRPHKRGIILPRQGLRSGTNAPHTGAGQAIVLAWHIRAPVASRHTQSPNIEKQTQAHVPAEFSTTNKDAPATRAPVMAEPAGTVVKLHKGPEDCMVSPTSAESKYPCR